MSWKGKKIYNQAGTEFGIATGHTKSCMMESCRGVRVLVRWSDGKRTWPCSAGLQPFKDGEKIIQ